MADLIDRQALLGFLDDITNDEEWLVNQYNADWIYSWIDCEPAVDAAEVVRCKDCKHYKRGFVFKDTMFCYRPDEGGDTIIRIFKDNDFCSYGERREEDG